MVTLDPVQTLTRKINAPLAQVDESFATKDGLSDWLADQVYLRAEVGGHLLLTWFNNRHVTGIFTVVEKHKQVAFTWRENNAELLVEADFQEQNGSTDLTLNLSGFAPDADVNAIYDEWNTHLDNLKLALESGEDGRITRRVIIGIYPADFNADIAAKLEVPVTEGTRVGNLIPNFGAEKAGLKPDDVVVAVNGQTVTNTMPMFMHMRHNRPGDSVEITYYRGSQKHTAPMILSGYPVPDTAADFAALAARTELTYADLDRKLSALFDGVSEIEAAQKPAEKEWSAMEVLAHLILSDRWMQQWIGTVMEGTGEAEGWSGNYSARIASITATYTNTHVLLAELRRGWAETVALLRHTPAEAAARKSNLWWINFEIDSMARHAEQHCDQIKAALAAARG
ncbi:MAG: SRPBCC domain-containing protein [Anaerolineae bacterium]|nr:SRPBCC domain-containing protein [Anaerolineae bacterium]